jgi:hypothetical protein
MSRAIFLAIFSIFFYSIYDAQGVLPVHRYVPKQGPLDRVNQPPSFGYSLRKIKRGYTGFAIRVRNATNSAVGDIAYDSTGIVSTNSQVTIVASGTSGFGVGTIQTFTAFKGAASLFVARWYDQGPNAYHADQTVNARQPELLMNTAGSLNNKPSIFFTGGSPSGSGKFLIINQPVQNILDQGIRGTFLWAMKPTANSAHFAFGYRNASTNWRWCFHVNWSDRNLYFDAAETCCAANRSIPNGANINLWKQYTIVRGTTYKTVRISGGTTGLNNSAAGSTTQTGGEFHIGSALNNLDATFNGNISELIMFNTDLNTTNVRPIENDQIFFWNL